MSKELTKQEFIDIMKQLNYDEHIFFMIDNKENRDEVQSTTYWLDYCINTWIGVSNDLVKESLDLQDEFKVSNLETASTNLINHAIPLLKLKIGMEALWTTKNQ